MLNIKILLTVLRVWFTVPVMRVGSAINQFPNTDHLVNSHDLCDGVCIVIDYKEKFNFDHCCRIRRV